MEIIKRFRLSRMLNNAFLIKNNEKVILIDAPDEIEKVIKYLEENKIMLDEVWLTHYHLDHILGLNMLRDKYLDLKVYISKEEIGCINNKADNVFMQYEAPDYKYVEEILDNQLLLKTNPNLKIEYISGHSKNSSVYIFKEEKVMFTGDVLFKQTIGRSDLVYGNMEKLITGIKEKLLVYEEMEVYTGHGFKTTIQEEKKGNPFLNE